MTRDRAAHRTTPWPHGLPTRVCDACRGSGLDRAAHFSYDRSRAVYADGARPTMACTRCDGRGRVIVTAPSEPTR